MNKILALIALALLSGCASFESSMYSAAEAIRAEAARANNGYKSEPATKPQPTAAARTEAVKPSVSPAQAANSNVKTTTKKETKPAKAKTPAAAEDLSTEKPFAKPAWAAKCGGVEEYQPARKYFACSANDLIAMPGNGVSVYTSIPDLAAGPIKYSSKIHAGYVYRFALQQ